MPTATLETIDFADIEGSVLGGGDGLNESRWKVTFEDVERSVQGLLAQGEQISVRAVRANLGDRGSFSTISRHLRALRIEGERTASVPAAALPDDLMASVAVAASGAWRALVDAADGAAAATEQRAAARVRVANEAVAGAEASVEALRRELKTQGSALAEAHATAVSLADERDEVREALARSERAEATAAARAQTLQARVDDALEGARAAETAREALTSELTEVRRAFDSAVQMHDTRADALERRSEAAEERLTAVRSEARELHARLSEALAHAEAERRRLETLERAIEATRGVLAQAERTIEGLRAEAAEARDHAAEAAAEAATAVERARGAEHAVALLREAVQSSVKRSAGDASSDAAAASPVVGNRRSES